MRETHPSTGAWIAGAALVGAGLLWWLTSSEAEAAVPEDPFVPTQKDGSSEVEMSQQNTYDQIRSGNVPAFLRDWKPVRVSANGITGTIFVSPDYLGIGTGPDYLRTPMYPATAQRLADELGFILPTKKMVEAIESQAIALPFHAHAPTSTMGRNSLAMWSLQNDEIRADLAGREGQLVAGHKKDIVIGGPVARNPGKVIIFGGKYANGSRVQPQSAVHAATYEDYSHGVRMIRPDMIVGDRGMYVRDVLADPRYSALISDEGATTAWRYQV